MHSYGPEPHSCAVLCILHDRWAKGKRHGRGVCTWASGARFEGAYRSNKEHGRATYVWPDGTSYAAEFKNGNMVGKGSLSPAAAPAPTEAGDGTACHRADTPTAAQIAAMPTLVYLGSDINFAMLHYLRDHEVRVACVDHMVAMPLGSRVFPDFYKYPAATMLGRLHKGPSLVKDTEAWRPWPRENTPVDRASRKAFSALAAERLRDEGFDDVCELSVSTVEVVLAFTLRGIPRRLEYVIASADSVFGPDGAIGAPGGVPYKVETLVNLLGSDMILSAVAQFLAALQVEERGASGPDRTFRLIHSPCRSDSSPLSGRTIPNYHKCQWGAEGGGENACEDHCKSLESVWLASFPNDRVTGKTDLTSTFPTTHTLSGGGTQVVAIEIRHDSLEK